MMIQIELHQWQDGADNPTSLSLFRSEKERSNYLVYNVAIGVYTHTLKKIRLVSKSATHIEKYFIRIQETKKNTWLRKKTRNMRKYAIFERA